MLYEVKIDTTRCERNILVYTTDSYTKAVKVAEEQSRRLGVLFTDIYYKGRYLESIWTGWYE